MGEKYVLEEFLGEESLGEKYMCEKYVQEEFLGEKYMCEKYMGEKSVGEKPLGENRGRWDAGLRSPFSGRYVCLHTKRNVPQRLSKCKTGVKHVTQTKHEKTLKL